MVFSATFLPLKGMDELLATPSRLAQLLVTHQDCWLNYLLPFKVVDRATCNPSVWLAELLATPQVGRLSSFSIHQGDWLNYLLPLKVVG